MSSQKPVTVETSVCAVMTHGVNGGGGSNGGGEGGADGGSIMVQVSKSSELHAATAASREPQL